jgi:hypothetical protein
MSLPGLTGQTSIHGRRLLDRPVKLGDDSKMCVNLNDKRQAPIPPMWGGAYSTPANPASTTTPVPEFDMLAASSGPLSANG